MAATSFHTISPPGLFTTNPRIIRTSTSPRYISRTSIPTPRQHSSNSSTSVLHEPSQNRETTNIHENIRRLSLPCTRENSFTKLLSNEAQAAMEGVRKSQITAIKAQSSIRRFNRQSSKDSDMKIRGKPNTIRRLTEEGESRQHISTVEHIGTVRLSEIFDKILSEKLEGDITDPKTSEKQPMKYVLGTNGGKLHNAMETVEIVVAQDDGDEELEEVKLRAGTPEATDEAIEEIARVNSINKCLVWMDAHDDADLTGTPEATEQ